MKSNPIPARWVTCKLDNHNTKEALPLFWQFRTACQASQPGDLDPTKGLGIPRESDFEGQQDLITRLPQDQKLQSWRAQTKLCLHQDSEKRHSDSTGNNQNYMLVLEGLLWMNGWTGAHFRDGGLATVVWEVSFWHKHSWSSALTWPLSPQTQGLDCHQQTIGLKLYWVTASLSPPVPPIRKLLHKLLSLLHQRADRRSKKNHNPKRLYYRKLISMKKQKVTFQMKGQDKTPEKQLNEVEIDTLPEKEFRIMIMSI